VDHGFNRVDGDLRQLHTEMNARFDGLQRTIIQVGGGGIIAVLATLASVLATRT